MKTPTSSHRPNPTTRLLLRLCAVALVTSSLSGCNTTHHGSIVVPVAVSAHTAALDDEGKQTSGIGKYVPGKGFEVDSTFRAYYSFLIAKWGATVTPPLTNDSEGLFIDSTGTYCPARILHQYMQMNDKENSGIIVPQKTFIQKIGL